jgi:hypothetical protein
MTELRETVINAIGFGVMRKSTYGEIADAVLDAIAREHVVIPLAWIDAERTEAMREKEHQVLSSFDRGYWDGCENQLCQLLTTFGPNRADVADPLP